MGKQFNVKGVELDLFNLKEVEHFLLTYNYSDPGYICLPDIYSISCAYNDSEVRNCLVDGTTEFLRPMPGADRMYPETDLELLKIPLDYVHELKRNLPKLRGEIEDDLKKKGLGEEMIKVLFKRGKLNEFRELYEIHGNVDLIGKLLLVYPKEIASKEKKTVEKIEEKITDYFGDILNLVFKDKLNKADVKHVLEKKSVFCLQFLISLKYF